MRVGITVMIGVEEIRVLKEEAKKRRISINKLISKIVSEYVRELERIKRERIREELKEVKRNG